MQSKILIDVDEAGKPCIRVDRAHSDDVRDKLVKMFFERLEYNQFVGVTIEGDHPVKLSPLTSREMLDWLYGKLLCNVRTAEAAQEVSEIIDKLKYILGCSDLPAEK